MKLKTLTNFRTYRNHTRSESVTPLGLAEYVLGRINGKLIVVTFRMAKRRGDFKAMNAKLVALWAGNQAGAGQPIHDLEPRVISKAIREKRLRFVIDEATED